EDLSGVDWDRVLGRYLPLVDRITTRSEFSDLLWELQGELGTSHAYERGGEYRWGPHYEQGFLGADWTFDSAAGGYPGAPPGPRGPRGPAPRPPPLPPRPHRRPRPPLPPVNGQRLGAEVSPGQRLVNQAGNEVVLTLRRDGEDQPRTATVKAVGDETPARYREWVESKRGFVHEASGGRVGYIHVPDMMPPGY